MIQFLPHSSLYVTSFSSHFFYKHVPSVRFFVPLFTIPVSRFPQQLKPTIQIYKLRICPSFQRIDENIYSVAIASQGWRMICVEWYCSLQTKHADGMTWHEATAVSLKITDSSRERLVRYSAAFDDSAARFTNCQVAMPPRVTTKLSLVHCGLIKIARLGLTMGRGLYLQSGLSTMPRVPAVRGAT